MLCDATYYHRCHYSVTLMVVRVHGYPSQTQSTIRSHACAKHPYATYALYHDLLRTHQDKTLSYTQAFVSGDGLDVYVDGTHSYSKRGVCSKLDPKHVNTKHPHVPLKWKTQWYTCLAANDPSDPSVHKHTNT
jgi:hypothetical protein